MNGGMPAMDKRSLSERDTCTKFITPALQRAGRDAMSQIREDVGFTKGRIMVHGKLVSRGRAKRANYVLYYNPNIPLALIEAKDNNHSVGEVIAAYMFDLDLFPASNMGHDAQAPDVRQMEIKMTQGKTIAIRHEPEHLIALHRPRGSKVRVIFNGPGRIAWDAAGAMASNGQRPIGLARLADLNRNVQEEHRLPAVREAPV